MVETMADPPDDPHLRDLAGVAELFPYPLPRVRDEAVCTELAESADFVLSRLARGRGALDISIGDLLDSLTVGDRLLQLGFASLGDYSRERLGLPGSTAVKMARFARQLRDRPLLRADVWAGYTTVRAAQAVLPVAIGDDEAHWAVEARGRTVRHLNAQVRGAGASPEGEELMEQWDRVCISLPDELRPPVDESMDIVGRMLGPDTPRWVRVEAVCQDFLGNHPLPEGEGTRPELPAPSMDAEVEAIKRELEEQTAQWAFLDQPPRVVATRSADRDETDPFALDAELQQLIRKRKGWDVWFGRMALIFRHMNGHLFLDFRSFGHYCEERLGMAEHTVQQRVSLERRLHQLPALRAALCSGKLSYEKARLIARGALKGSVDGWIERAPSMTCIELKRALEAAADTQMCAREEFAFVAPPRVTGMLADVFRAVRRVAGRSMSPGECLNFASGEFADTWRGAVPKRDPLMERDLGRCLVPSCSHPAVHRHHIVYVSRGGSDDPSNFACLCLAHHLSGVHKGYIRVRGKAPDNLYWELGLRRDQLPLLAFSPRSRKQPHPQTQRPPAPRPPAAPDRSAGQTATT